MTFVIILNSRFSNMKNTIRLFISASILLVAFTPMNSIAKTKQHRIGYGYHYGGELDTCRYWITGDKKKVVFHELYHLRYAYMNIDNEEVKFVLASRKEINQNGKQIGYRDKYEAKDFQVDTHLTDTSEAKNKKSGISKRTGDLVVRDNNGWQKSLKIECVAYPD
jgi:hypothetical protein